MKISSALAICTICICFVASVAAKEKITKWEATNRHANAQCYPNVGPIVQNFSLALEFFSPNLRSRNRNAANFTTFLDSVEFFFGVKAYNITAYSGTGSGPYYYAGYTIRQYSESDDAAFAVIDYDYRPTVIGNLLNLPTAPYTTMSAMTFDEDGYIDQYDVVAPSFGFTDFNFPTFTPANRKAAAIPNICNIHQTYCANSTSTRQYANVTDCQTQLSALPWGEDLIYNGDNLVCRAMWSNLVRFRPNVHCVSLAATPGPRCNNANTYPTYYIDDEILFPKSFVGSHK